MNRRNFIKSSLTATAGVGLVHMLQNPLKAMTLQSKYLDTIGLQLWTVRNQLNDDQKKTLTAVKDAGYKQVELMDVGQADAVMPICKDLGLNVTSSFIDWNSICNPTNKGTPTIDSIIEKAASLGLKHLVFGYIGKGSRETVDQYKQYSWRANDAGVKCKKVGIQLCYHNHSFEFGKLKDTDTTGWDLLVKHLDRDAVKFELDVFWAKVGGLDPIATLKNLKGRVSQVHLKDLKEGTGVIHDEGQVPHEAFKECGNGTIDMAEVMKVSEEIGVAQCHVEQDQSPNPINSVGTSMKHLLSLK